MKYIPHENHQEPAMRYEGLACYAFDCERMQDPGTIADASFFDRHFIELLTSEGLNAMHSIIDQLVNKENKKEKTELLNEVRQSLTIGMEQKSSIELLDYIIKILKE